MGPSPGYTIRHVVFLSRRWIHGRQPKCQVADKHKRPVLELYVVLMHGVGVFFFLGDESTTCGSSMSAECLLRALSKAWTHWHRKTPGKPFPGFLYILADNTVKEVKNSIWARMLICMTSASVFKGAIQNHLKVGRTHEDGGTC